MKKTLSCLAALLLAVPAFSQEGILGSILFLTGATDPSELDESVVDGYEALAAHPLQVNSCTAGRLVASGLFTPYQVASLMDYRSRTGDVLSVMELSLVDGFASGEAEALRPFLSFEPAAAVDSLPPKRTFLSRAALSEKGGDASGTFGIKYRRNGSRHSFGLAVRRAGSGTVPGTVPSGEDPAVKWDAPQGTFYWMRTGRKVQWILGDFNARFGEGICLWTGFDLRNASTLDALSRRAGGLAPSWSWTGSGTLRGLAVEGERGPSGIAAALTGSGAMVRFSRLGKASQAGLTAVLPWNAVLPESLRGGGSFSGNPRIALDGKASFRGLHGFGEVAFGGPAKAFAGVGGLRFGMGEHLRSGLRIRIEPTGYTGKKYGSYTATGALEWRSGKYVLPAAETRYSVSVPTGKATLLAEGSLLPEPGVDPGRKELRIIASGQFRAGPFWVFTPRVLLRFRTFDPVRRIDLRTDAAREGPVFTARSRMNLVIGDGPAFLAFAEAGWKSRSGGGSQSFREVSRALWVRGTVFRADRWNDRIWCYERDAPGTFSVPAYSGRGYALSLYGTLTRPLGRTRLRLYARLGWLGYEKKPGKAELKLQSTVDF